MKVRQPYIPLYIGDWEQDTNCLSLEAEGALLKLTFKLWKAPTKGLVTISFSQMAILFKKSVEDTIKIFQELVDNEMFDYDKINQNIVNIKSRRMLRETQISRVKSENGAKGGRPKMGSEKLNKSKEKLNTDNEYDIDTEDESDNTIEFRRKNFYEKVGAEFSAKYPKEMLIKFCNYWTEYNEGGSKMKFEMQKVFNISMRLTTWSNNNFGNNGKQAVTNEGLSNSLDRALR